MLSLHIVATTGTLLLRSPKVGLLVDLFMGNLVGARVLGLTVGTLVGVEEAGAAIVGVEVTSAAVVGVFVTGAAVVGVEVRGTEAVGAVVTTGAAVGTPAHTDP